MDESRTRSAPAVRRLPGKPALEPGQELGAYRLVRRLGEGGFGQVFEASHLRTGRRVALKVLAAPASAAREVIERFRREGRLAASLDHPSCVFVFGAEEVEGRPVIAMELMPGGTLQDLLARQGPLPYREAVDDALQVLDGLEAAHAVGVVHRDVKPSNCFLDRSGAVRLGDFGLSKTLDLDSDLTTAGSYLGTPSYSSPEQVRGRDVDPSSDLYSLGATLYALLTGRPPFTGNDGSQVLARILTEPPTPFAAHRASVPAGLQRVVLRMLAKDKSRRYPSSAALRSALLPYSSRGLAAAGPGPRLIAFLVDTLAIQVAMGMAAGAAYVVDPISLPHQLALLALTFAYFAVQEGGWGRTIGKRLLGLRLVMLGGGSATLGAVAIRVSLFSGIQYGPIAAFLAVNPGVSSLELGRSLSFWLLAVALPYAALVGTMRRGNGFAALHDLASGTRVRVTVTSRSSVPDVGSRLAADARPSPLSFGPYRDARVVWDAGDESLLLARDPELRRDVWIHGFRGTVGASPSSLAEDRPGRLHWLQGVRADRGGWDAFEAPSGLTLVEWVAAKRRLPWGKVREVLLDLAVELAARQGRAEAAPRFSIGNVWVDGHGQTRLLDFPVDPRDPAEGVPGRDWRAFLHQVLLLACEGRSVEPAALGTQVPRVPLPEHVRPLVESLCGRDSRLVGPADVAAAIRGLAGRPAAVTRARRLGPLVVTAVPGLFMLFSVAFAVRGAPDVVRLAGTLRRSGAALERLDGAADEANEANERTRLLRRLRAHTYAELRDVATRSTNLVAVRVARDAIGGVGAEERAAMVSLSREPSPTPDELAAARRDLEALEPSASLWGLVLGFFLTGLAPLAIPALLLAPVARGGALLRLFATSLQTTDGRRAGRGRSLVRAAFAWGPFVLFFFWRPWLVFHVVFPLVLAIGVIGTLVRPERSLPDLLAGTHLVPR